MTEMRAAFTARDLGPAHAVAAIFFGFDIFFRDGLIKTGPARAGFIFRFGIEEFVTASDAFVNAGLC
jgi:hypothetical protein